MQLPKARQIFSDLEFHEALDSTNLQLARNLSPTTRHFSAVLAASQSAGQGRLERNWESPASSSLAISIYLEPEAIPEPGWVTLLAALAVKRTIAQLGIVGGGVKWPNDVLVAGKKVSGVLAQLLPGGAVILGIGLNLRAQGSELANATSLQELGVECDFDSAAALIGSHLRQLLEQFLVDSVSIKEQFAQNCVTLGLRVRAELPGGGELVGLASEIDGGGQLVILSPEAHSLSAADVWHLRS